MLQVNAKDGQCRVKPEVLGRNNKQNLGDLLRLACLLQIHRESQQCTGENMIIDHLGCTDKCVHSNLSCEQHNVSECHGNGPFWDQIFSRTSIKKVLLRRLLGMPQWMFLSHFEQPFKAIMGPSQVGHRGLGRHRSTEGAMGGSQAVLRSGAERILQDVTPCTFDPLFLPNWPISKAFGTCRWGKLGGAQVGRKPTPN